MNNDRPCIVVRRTGERIYLDDREPHRESASPDYERPAPPIFIECELCGRPWQQVEWARFDTPFVCGSCTYRVRIGLKWGDVSTADHRVIGAAHAVLRTLESEVKNGRRAAVAV